MEETNLAFIEADSDRSINVTVVGYETEKIISKLKFKNIKNFIDEMESLFKQKVKAVILDIFDAKDSEYLNNVEICIIIKEKLNELKIPYIFVCKASYILSCLLIAENITAKINEIILIFWAQNDGANCTELKFTKNGFEIIDRRLVNLDAIKLNKKEIRKTLIGTLCPQKIYFFPSIFMQINGARKLCKSKNLVICELANLRCIEKFLVETYKWMLDKSYNKFYIIPICERKWEIGFKDSRDKSLNVIVCKNGSLLPFKKSIEIPKTSLQFFMAYSDSDEKYEICAFPLNQNAHRYDLTLMIDENNMPKYNISRIESQNIINLPQKFDETITTKMPVISFFDNSSVICVHKNAEKNGYQFLESWNGKYGNELYIAFDKEELTYCSEAIKIYQTKPSFVICDLLKIMSMPLKEVLSIKTLSFSITKDQSKNDILLEFDNFDGTRKIASPAFLMALLLEQHLKVINAEINETPKELYFCFPYDRDIENRKRIVKWIQESCKLAKINCNFVDA